MTQFFDEKAFLAYAMTRAKQHYASLTGLSDDLLSEIRLRCPVPLDRLVAAISCLAVVTSWPTEDEMGDEVARQAVIILTGTALKLAEEMGFDSARMEDLRGRMRDPLSGMVSDGRFADIVFGATGEWRKEFEGQGT